MSSTPMPISRPRAPPSVSSNSSSASSASTSVRSTASTPPRPAMSLSARNSLTMSLSTHGHPNSAFSSQYHRQHLYGPNQTHGRSNSNEGDIPFLGTPFASALERPYEYPFPSPATESCPNLAATSATMGSMGLGLVHVPPPVAGFVQSPTTNQTALPLVLPPPPMPSSPGTGPFTARMPLRRRASYATGNGNGAPLPSPPVPPSLTIKARALGSRTGTKGRNTMQR